MSHPKPTEVQVLVYHVKRGPSSAMGNPSYVFHTDHGPYRTQTDSGAVYGLENDFSVGVKLDVPATLTISPWGRVLDWKL